MSESTAAEFIFSTLGSVEGTVDNSYAVFTDPSLTTEFLYTTLVEPIGHNVTERPTTWSVNELKILGGVLWVVILITLVGNLACFYAVFKNLKQILQHPFFQSNVFCVYLSLVDIFQVVMVGIPAAVCYTSDNPALRDDLYNRAVVDPILDFVVWLQLLLVVAICMDRAGHICSPFHYTHTIKAYKTVFAIVTCTAIPLLTLTLPYVAASRSVMKFYEDRGGDPNNAFVCSTARKYDNNGDPVAGGAHIFMSCVLQVSNDTWAHADSYQMWENISYPLLMFLAVAALVGSNGVIVYKLMESGRFQKDNVQRQDEVARSIRLTCTVSFCQAILILASTLPLRWYQIDHRLNAGCKGKNCWDPTKYTTYYTVTVRVLVFLGPMFNPWLYPIRMASIRSFLVTKRKTVVSTVNTSLMRLKSFYTQPTVNNETNNTVQTQLLSDASLQAPSQITTTTTTGN